VRAILWSVALGLLAQSGAPAAVATQIAGVRSEYRTSAGDTLAALGARAGVDAATLARRNGLKPGAALKPDTVLRIDAVHIVPAADVPLVVNIPQRMLFLSTGDGVLAVPVSVGRSSWPTPTGDFTVVAREEDPTWDVPVSIQAEMQRAGKTPVSRVPPSADNPLGAFWLGLSLPGIGIHGTNAPDSIYRFATHGCIRVHPDRIAGLFERIEVGLAGRIVYEPLLLAAADGAVYVEVHPDSYRRSPVTIAQLRALAGAAGLDGRIDWGLAAAAIKARDGIAIDVSAPMSTRGSGTLP